MGAKDRVLRGKKEHWILRRILEALPERNLPRVACICRWWGDTVQDMTWRKRPIQLSFLLRQLVPLDMPWDELVRGRPSLTAAALYLIQF